MPPWAAELMKLFGFTTPFVYAAATYGVFHWLDKKASGPAKKAMSDWLQNVKSKPLDQSVVLDLFDRIYTPKLLSFKAFWRSTQVTLFCCAITWLSISDIIPALLYTFEDRTNVPPRIQQFSQWSTSSLIVFTILTDYVSLFFVRRWLAFARSNPIASLLSGAVVGTVIVALSFLIRVWSTSLVLVALEHFDSVNSVLTMYFSDYRLKLNIRQVLPAFFVHFWLPIFALAIVIAQLLVWLAKAADWMRWFLKQGQHHPFLAVGYVASAIVFVGTFILHYAWR